MLLLILSNLDSTLSVFTSLFNFGCIDSSACNYDVSANINDGSCILPDGCTDSSAIGYDSLALCNDGSCIYTIGEYWQGGIIVYIDASGKHGLIASPQIGTSAWGCNNLISMPGANNFAIGAGYQNTIDIISSCGTGTAAGLCNNLVLNGYSDWFLPTVATLSEISNNFTFGAGTYFAGGSYWSSNWHANSGSSMVGFGSALSGSYGRSAIINVLAVRAF